VRARSVEPHPVRQRQKLAPETEGDETMTKSAMITTRGYGMWTMDNTEGFTQAELDTLNTALDRLARNFPDVEPANINDALNNAWVDGISVDDLVAQAGHRFA
jgi:hypothetical protein